MIEIVEDAGWALDRLFSSRPDHALVGMFHREPDNARMEVELGPTPEERRPEGQIWPPPYGAQS
jgi:hypothetical protein